MQAIINSLAKQGQQGAFKASTVRRAEQYLAKHPMCTITVRGQALRNLVASIRGAA